MNHVSSATNWSALNDERESDPSNRQLRVTLDHALLQLRAFVRAPSLGAVRDAVAGRASIGHRYSVGKVKGTKLAEVLAKAQTLFA